MRLVLLGLAACGTGTPPGPQLTECDRYFLDVTETLCDGVDKSEITCESLACSQASLTFESTCLDADACCAYRDCWSTWESCMASCSGSSDVDGCLDQLGRCVSDELAP